MKSMSLWINIIINQMVNGNIIRGTWLRQVRPLVGTLNPPKMLRGLLKYCSHYSKRIA